MNHALQPFLYLASGECDRPELPVAFEVRRLLRIEGMSDKAAVIKTVQPVYREGLSDFVVLAKGTDSITSVYEGKDVFVFLLPLDDRAGAEILDLSAGLQPVLDWCSVSSTLEAAIRWQVRS
jgi:hypothetical protein